jgi:hypothetical protein
MTEPALDALIDRHAAVLGWLARLEQSRPHVSDHVAARVRDDYRARLRDVEAELAPHLDALREMRAALGPELDAAAELHAAAAEMLDEARLRYLAGELGEDEWLERAPALEADAREMYEEKQRIAARAGALHALVTRLDGSAEAGTDAPAAEVWGAAPQSGAAALPGDEGLPHLELLEEAAADGAPDRFDEMDFLHWVAGDAAPPADRPAPSAQEQDDAADAEDEAAFLAELDRALGR